MKVKECIRNLAKKNKNLLIGTYFYARVFTAKREILETILKSYDERRKYD